MTDEKKQPEEDELGEEQLDGVAGGIMPASTSEGGIYLGSPDVCDVPLTGDPLIPTPYPNTTSTSDGATKTTKTKIDPSTGTASKG